MLKTTNKKIDVEMYRTIIDTPEYLRKKLNIHYDRYFNFYTFDRSSKIYTYPICEQKQNDRKLFIEFNKSKFKEKYFSESNGIYKELQLWQRKAIKFINDRYTKGSKGAMVISETGTGKSIIIGSTIALFKQKTLIVVPNSTISKGLYDKFKDYCDIGIIKGKEIKEKIYDVTILHYQTFNKYYDYIKDKFSILILDEVHKSPRTRIDQINKFDGLFVLGLTATPQRKEFNINGYRLYWGRNNIFKSGAKSLPVKIIVYKYKYEYTMKDYITASEGYKPESPEIFRQLVINNEDRIKELSRILKILKRKGIKRVVVFTDRTQHVKKIKEMIGNIYKNLYTLEGSVKNKGEIIDELNNKDEYLLVSMIQMAGEGTDISNLECAIQFVSTKWINTIMQGMGRTKRFDGDKTNGIYIDFQDIIKIEGLSKITYLGNKSKVYKEQGLNFITFEQYTNGLIN